MFVPGIFGLVAGMTSQKTSEQNEKHTANINIEKTLKDNGYERNNFIIYLVQYLRGGNFEPNVLPAAPRTT